MGSECYDPEGIINCGEPLDGCLNGYDWRYYTVNSSANKEVTVNLVYSGEGCNINDLYVYNNSCNEIGSIENTEWNKSWNGFGGSDITVGLDGDSNDTNCLWTLNVTCVTVTTSTTTTSTSTSTSTTTTTLGCSSGGIGLCEVNSAAV